MNAQTLTASLSFIVISTVLSVAGCVSHDSDVAPDNVKFISVGPSTRIYKPEELLNLQVDDRLNYDSSIFVKGIIKRLDPEHGEILLNHSFQGKDFICLMKDDADFAILKKYDKVLFKGVCKKVGNDNLILLVKCELAQLGGDSSSR